jgi:hypothetical protein
VSDEDSNVVPLPQADNERAPAQRRRTS